MTTLAQQGHLSYREPLTTLRLTGLAEPVKSSWQQFRSNAQFKPGADKQTPLLVPCRGAKAEEVQYLKVVF